MGSPVQNHHNFKRKHKNFPTDWCKNYENRIRNKEFVTFWNFSENTTWPVLMNMQMSELIMSSPHNFLHMSFTKLTKIENVNLALYPPSVKWEIMFILIYFDTRICFYLNLEEKIQNFIYITSYDKLRGDDITNSLIWIFIRTGQWNGFPKKCEISNCHNFLTLLIRFASFLHQSVGKFLLFLWNYGNSGLDFPFKGWILTMQLYSYCLWVVMRLRVRLSLHFWHRIQVSKRLSGWFLQMINAKLFWLGG